MRRSPCSERASLLRSPVGVASLRRQPRDSYAPTVRARHRRLIAVTSGLPWPLTSGGHLRSFHLLRALARDLGHVTLVAPVETLEPARIAALQEIGLEVDPIVVGPRTTAGEARRGLRSVLTGRPYAFYHRHYWPALRRRLVALVADQRPHALYLDHLDSFQYADVAPARPCILDMHNVYSAILLRDAERRGPLVGMATRIEAARVAAVERRAVKAAALTLSVSEDDARVFRVLAGRRIEVVPNGVDCGAYAALPTGRDMSVPKLAYVGALSWGPNAAAAHRLATTILDAVRRRYPSAEAHIIGKDPTPEVRALADRPGVHVFADVPDVRPYLAGASTLVVPLEVGGGTRLKILEAFAAGLPVVSTRIGCEGLSVRDAVHLLVAEGADLADAVCRLVEEPGLGARLAQQGRVLALESYDWQAVGRVATEAIESVMEEST